MKAGFIYLSAWLMCAGQLFAVETNQTADAHSTRPASWAVKLEKPGLENLHQVSTNLYRGAQPTSEGMAQLKTMGIKTVINLREFHSDKSKLAGSGLKGERLHTEPWHAETADVVHFLKIVTDTNKLPAFVHCQRGADRTGVMCAIYRVTVCGWTKQEAIKEMTQGGFEFSPAWKNLVEFVEKADVEEIRRQAGIRPPKPVQ